MDYTIPSNVANHALKKDLPFVNVRFFGLKGDGTTNDTSKLQDMVDSFTTGCRIVFEPEKTYLIDRVIINNQKIILDLNGATITTKKGATTRDLIRFNNATDCGIVNGKIVCSDATDGMDSKIECIKVIVGQNFLIENIVTDKMTYTIKLDDGVSSFKNLTATNVKGLNCGMFFHLAELDGFFATNLYSELGANTTQLEHHYYIKPKVNNIFMNNIHCKNSGGGHAIQFNRYISGTPTQPIFTSGYENKNINITNLTCDNVGSALMLNSEVYNLNMSNVIATNLNRSDVGLFTLYAGYCDRIKISNVCANNIKTLFRLSEFSEGAGLIEIRNVTVDGKQTERLKNYGGKDNTKSVKKLILDNIVYNDFLWTGYNTALLGFFAGNFNSIIINGLSLKTPDVIPSILDTIRFNADFIGTVTASNCELEVGTGSNANLQFFNKTTGANIKMYANFIRQTNIKTMFNNLSASELKQTSCYSDFVLVP